MLIGRKFCPFVQNGQKRCEMENYILRKSLFVDTFYVGFDEFDGKKFRFKIFARNILRYIGFELATYNNISLARPAELGSDILPILLSLLANK